MKHRVGDALVRFYDYHLPTLRGHASYTQNPILLLLYLAEYHM